MGKTMKVCATIVKSRKTMTIYATIVIESFSFLNCYIIGTYPNPPKDFQQTN